MSSSHDSTSLFNLRGYRHIWPHILPARWCFGGGLLAGAVYALSTGFGLPVLIKAFFPIFFGQEDKAPPIVIEYGRRFFGDDYIHSLLLLACFGLPLIFLLRGLGAYYNRYLINKAGFMVLDGLRNEAFNRLQHLPLAFYQNQKSGDLVVRLIKDTEQLKNVVVNISAEIIKQPLTLIAALGSLVYLSWKDSSAIFAIIAIVTLPLCIMPIRMAARRIVKRSRQAAQEGGDLGAFVTEALQSPLEIQAYNLQDRQRERFQARVRDLLRLSLKSIKYQASVSPTIEFISVTGFMIALYLGATRGMDFATFSALGIALYMCYEPIKKLSGLHAMIKVGGASMERLEYILEAEDSVPSPATPAIFPPGRLVVDFCNVSFSYNSPNTTSRAALHNVTVRIEPGETVALVGASGAGKSTFVSLIPRFYDVLSGKITLGGIDLRQLSKRELRDHIAIVPQSPLLFNATIAENIRIGRPEATDAEVHHAAERACVADFIATLPHGYKTVVGERGTSLSGGQRQRIAIARAFLKDAPILILDEATSALDSESEARIQQALSELVRGRTTFMIAHRFSSIRIATRILVFEHGQLIADGNHSSLYAASSRYKELYDHQLTAS